ncbi:hypothetical protein LC048_00795 [Mesobacillus subterraneus]|uniref:hypothetical protein n=1 Tax=Mesobacillus subterraneus TaxID=285983 RepID=UPI001CFE2E6C|nr:hypothetical protein [Mesobacillus subterraneus]WLR55591.1 hypothetical protein LC048_00795 [Mesobacillus subterraneus]
MCVSNNAIEHQAYHYSEKIQESSLYNIVRVDFNGGTFIKSVEGISFKDEFQDMENLPLIKSLILQSKAGKQFSVEPDELGVQFAKGYLSYNRYLLAKKQESRKLIYYTLGSTGLFTAMAWSFVSYFL